MTSVNMPFAMRRTVSGSSTSPNERRFAHISAAPANEAAAANQVSTLTLSHPGEKTSRVSNCRTMRAM